MKQRITTQQLEELTDLQRQSLRKWYVVGEGDYIAWKNNSRQKKYNVDLNYNDSEYGYVDEPNSKLTGKWEAPLLSIGQMLEFLDICVIYLENEAGWWGIKTTESLQDIEPVPELCDALWEVIKIRLTSESISI